MFIKLIGIITSLVILNQATGIGAEQMKYLTNIVKITLTQSETDSIAHVVYTGKVIENDGRLPYLSEEEWAEYIRKQMESKAQNRDTSKDLWIKPYKIMEMDTVPGRSGPGFIVRSSGPDGSCETKDDIISGYEYR
ncbi:MAG TPA: hypothetical protein PKG52_10085 [bacterium]|mgnify:CR=1 FL=1|nr:hypothetical protein [bacterium]HPS28757.1 hypothetical protein [bacterium]